MEYYCIMVKTGAEEKFKVCSEKKLSDGGFEFKMYFFRKTLRTRGGEYYDSPLFPGYVFLETEEFSLRMLDMLRRVDGFYHFLHSNTDIAALVGNDLDYLRKFAVHGEVLGASKAHFDKNQRIVITEGPLEGFQGNIIRVNKKCTRVTVLIDMCGSAKTVDLMYDLVEPVKE